ncbi:hypothetical protein OG21DRAFT_1528160, partial [Imleria badia]
KFIQHAIDRYNTGITLSKIYDIDQLEAMHLADEAWAGILPDFNDESPMQSAIPVSSLVHPVSWSNSAVGAAAAAPASDPMVQAENLLQAALNDLELCSVLQHSNQMNISELLNPAAESHDIFNASEKDIHNAVMEAKRVQEQSTLLGNDDNDPESVEPDISYKEALTAAMSLQKYTKNIDNPLAHKLEVVLSTFGQMTLTEKMKSMRDTKLTSYFASK